MPMTHDAINHQYVERFTLPLEDSFTVMALRCQMALEQLILHIEYPPADSENT